jgi:hypothetical protein
MKEHPILFSPVMVRALIAGRKSVTRRLSPQWMKVKAGDRLWVRETCESYPLPNILTGEPTDATCARYSADKSAVLSEDGFDFSWWYSKPVCPNIHMPRWASRILLDVEEDTRPERLQEITEEDAIAEGVTEYFTRDAVAVAVMGSGTDPYPSRRNAFAYLWSTLHTKPGERWEDNPTVYRVGKFHQIEVSR